LGAAEFVLVAYSMSGRWAQWMSCTKPERAIGQVLIGPAPASAMPLAQELVDQWIQAVGTRDGYHRFETQFTKSPLAGDVLDECFADVKSTPEHTLRETIGMCAQPGFAEKLASVRVPTLVLGGIHDPLIPPDYLRQEAVHRIPGARLALLDCGHNAPLEKPLETAALIEAFLAGLNRKQSTS